MVPSAEALESGKKRIREELQISKASRKSPTKTDDEHPQEKAKARMVEEAAKGKVMSKEAKRMVEEMTKNPELLRTLQQEATKIVKEKCLGTFERVPYEVLDELQKGNVLRELDPKMVQKKVETIRKDWDDFTLVTGCVSSEEWSTLEEWLKGDKDPAQLPEVRVETLDGQHRREAARILQEKGTVPNPKVLLQLYVDLTPQEKVTVTNNLIYMQEQQEKMTLVNLLRMIRERWVQLVFEQSTDLPQADSTIVAEFNFQIAASTNSIKAEEAEKLAQVKAKERDARLKTVVKIVQANHYKIKWAYQVPPMNAPFRIWPVWYQHLTNMQEKGKPYSVDSLSGMQGITSPRLRYSVMLFAALESLEGSEFKILCSIIKGKEELKEWFQEKVVARWVKLTGLNPRLSGPKATAQKEEWLRLFTKPCSPVDVLSLASEKDWSHVADAVTRSILYASRDGGSTLVDWVHLFRFPLNQTVSQVISSIQGELPVVVDTTCPEKGKNDKVSHKIPLDRPDNFYLGKALVHGGCQRWERDERGKVEEKGGLGQDSYRKGVHINTSRQQVLFGIGLCLHDGQRHLLLFTLSCGQAPRI